MDVPSILSRYRAIQARTAPTPAGAERGRMALRVENASDKAEVYVYDIIGEWGFSAGDMVAELRAIGDKPIDLHINSEGGSVFDGLAIYNALRNHSKPITGYVDALAASAASFIVMAAAHIVIQKNASMMIHDALGFAFGNAADMRALAELLDESSETIAEIYDDHAGGGVPHWRDLMKAETWFRGQAAVDAGLADEVATPKQKNQTTPRIAAQAASLNPEPNTAPVIDFAAAIRAARLEPATPSLQQLLETEPEPLSTILKGA